MKELDVDQMDVWRNEGGKIGLGVQKVGPLSGSVLTFLTFASKWYLNFDLGKQEVRGSYIVGL